MERLIRPERRLAPLSPFARRASFELEEGGASGASGVSESPAASVLREARASGRPFVDLSETNPTRVGLGGGEALVALLGDPRGAGYAPDPLGEPGAREAVSGYLASRGLEVPPGRIALTASTSEAYGFLFKLLADPGDRVLVPTPSYPLLPHLAALEGIRLEPYPLLPEEDFALDPAAIERLVDAGARPPRALVAVHPNNPTGSFVRAREAAFLEELAASRGIALIADEVFADYPSSEAPPDRLPGFAALRSALSFSLGGLSKLVGMPQVKLGWIAVGGPSALADEAMRRLELVADTYLSVGTPIQRALPEILDRREPFRAAIAARVAENRRALDEACREEGAPVGLRRLRAGGGWTAILEVPRTRDEDAWLSGLAQGEGVIVHPGYFYDLPRDGYLVLSLLPDPGRFRDAAFRLARYVARG